MFKVESYMLHYSIDIAYKNENCCSHFWFGCATRVNYSNTSRQLTVEVLEIRLQLTAEENFGSKLPRKTENFGS